jgi:type II secretory ATPase GspE/PulE/Tfp pilus assembly ATPase PilB-like protein
MVGEIRDKETADVAVQAALTGHKVLSTIHTNDAAGALPRLMEMGIKGFLLADALNMIIGQRLVRRLCPHCRREVSLKPEEQAFVDEILSKMPANHGVEIPSEIKFYTSDGCSHCSGIGYKGRIGVYEVLTVTDGIRDLLSRESISFMDVRRTAASEGVLNMQQDALLKAVLGITDVKEVMRVVG